MGIPKPSCSSPNFLLSREDNLNGDLSKFIFPLYDLKIIIIGYKVSEALGPLVQMSRPAKLYGSIIML